MKIKSMVVPNAADFDLMLSYHLDFFEGVFNEIANIYYIKLFFLKATKIVLVVCVTFLRLFYALS